MGAIQELAIDLGIEERTLRRAVSQGTLRSRRMGPRRLRLAPGERSYLLDHWQLLSQLRQALRTERQIRLAVLYGSVARGEEDAGSDLDLLVSFADNGASVGSQLAIRLGRAIGHTIDIADLARVDSDAPLLMSRVLDEGRVLVDRDGIWSQLRDRRRAIDARAQRAYRRNMDKAAGAIEELIGG
jgi:predicted nucleotidyltransferase